MLRSLPQNILILSAGRRYLLVRYFQQELSQVQTEARVLAADMQPAMSSACQAADDCFATPPIQDPNYIERVLELCIQNRVRVVIPTIDTDLLLLADSRDRFSQCDVELLVSDHELIRQCRDKRLTSQLFSRHGLRSPQCVDPLHTDIFPLIAKPYDGSSSNNLHFIETRSDLRPELLNEPKLVFYEFLSHDEHDEYTIDLYYDRGGVLKCFVPRLRLATRAGEVSKGRTSKLPALQSLREKFRHIPGARGCLTMQLFVRTRDGNQFGIEINPRFGGGYPLSHEAGANFPAWIVAEYLNHESIPYFDAWQDQLTMLRYDAHILVRSAA